MSHTISMMLILVACGAVYRATDSFISEAQLVIDGVDQYRRAHLCVELRVFEQNYREGATFLCGGSCRDYPQVAAHLAIFAEKVASLRQLRGCQADRSFFAMHREHSTDGWPNWIVKPTRLGW